MQQTNPWDNDAVVPAGGGMVITKPADPGRQYEGAQAAANLEARRLENAKLAREAAQADSGEGALDPATRTLYAQQVIAGAPMPSLGMGKQAAANRQLVMNEVARIAGAQGLNGADLARQIAHYKAGSKAIGTLETMAGTIGVNEQTALANGQQFLDRSRELPGQTGITPLNSLVQAIQRTLPVPGHATVAAMDASYGTFANEYAKVVSGSPSGAGTLSDSARHEAMATIRGNGSMDQKQAAFDQMSKDMANRMVAIHGGINNAYKALTSQPGYQVPYSTDGLAAPTATDGQRRGAPLLSGTDFGTGGTPPPPVPGPDGGAATGAMRHMRYPERENEVAAAIRSMASPEEIGRRYPGTDVATIARIQAQLRTNPNTPFRVRSEGDVPTTAFQRLAGGPLDTPVGAFVGSANNSLTGGLSAKLTGTEGAMAALAAAHPTASAIGDIVGAAGGAALTGGALSAAGRGLGTGLAARVLASPITADAVFGGVSGATGGSDPVTGALGGAALGAGGGMFGRGLTNTLSGAVGGIRNGAVDYLRNAGVPLTVGQAVSGSGRIGAIAKGIEDKLTSAPIVGDMIRARRLEGMEGFNRSAFNQALAPIGATTNGVTNEAGVDAALNAIGQGYRNALNGVSLTGDQPFRADVASAVQRGSTVPTYGPDFSTIMRDEVSPIVAGSPTISGDQFQQLKRTLGGYERQYGRIAQGTPMVPPAPIAGRVSTAFGDLDNSLDGLVARQAPQVAPAYDAANGAYRNVKVVQDAVNRARNGTRVGEPGIFAPSQLADAAAGNAKTFGNTAGTTQQPFFDLTRAGQAVLPSAIPDSGTAGRLSALALPGVLGGAGYAAGGQDGAETGSLGGLTLAGALALGGTRVGQRALTAALLDRPDTLRRAGTAIAARRGMFGAFGAGLGLLPVTGQ